MRRKPLESLGAIVRERRGERKLRETAKEIGIGPATLMRVEAGRIPDVETFGKICKWLKMDPAEFLGIDKKVHVAGTHVKSTPVLSLSAHFKADKTPMKETVQALAQMVILALETQSRVPSPED